MQICLRGALMHWYKKSPGSINWSSVRGMAHPKKEFFRQISAVFYISLQNVQKMLRRLTLDCKMYIILRIVCLPSLKWYIISLE